MRSSVYFKPISVNYQLSGCFLKWSSTVKYVGVILNTKLAWDDQCAYVASKASRLLIYSGEVFLFVPLLRRIGFPVPCYPNFRLCLTSMHGIHLLRRMLWNWKLYNFVQLAGWQAAVLTNVLLHKWSKPSLECHSDLHWPVLFIRSATMQYLLMLMVYDILHRCIALNISLLLLHVQVQGHVLLSIHHQ